MVIKIHQVCNTENALMYNEKKVKQGVASFFDSRNTISSNPFMYDEKHRLKNLVDIEKLNPRVKNKCFHISFNPSTEDYLKLGDATIRKEIGNMMEHMGYSNQPYFVYKHQDLERVHFHIVSTRVDHQTGKKIKDNYEKQKMQKFIHGLEQKYQLTQGVNKETFDFKFSPRSRNIKQNLENLFKHLNQVNEITSKEMFNEALKLFNVEVRRSGRGYIVVVTDGEGKPIRYPIRLSNFKEKPRFHVLKNEQMTKRINSIKDSSAVINTNNNILKSLISKEIFSLMQSQLFDDERNKKYKLKHRKKRLKNRF